jgi:predicted transposase/invertase (TIGR01784 family)
MKKYLDPKNDLMFKKVFGEHKDLCISLLNSLLRFDGNERIVEIEYEATELVPEIFGLKNSILDVRCKDRNARQFIVEMQMDWTKDFQQRVLFNASKAYVRPLKKGEEYSFLQPVYSLCLINDIFDKTPEAQNVFYHQYKIVNIVDTNKQIKGLEFVFIELPKYTSANQGDQDYFDLWLRYLTEIDECAKEISPDLLGNEDIAKAIECAEEASLTPAELDIYDKVQDAIRSKKTLMRGAEEKGREEGKEIGREEGEKQKAIEIAKKMKQRGVPLEEIVEFTDLPVEEIEKI